MYELISESPSYFYRLRLSQVGELISESPSYFFRLQLLQVCELAYISESPSYLYRPRLFQAYELIPESPSYLYRLQVLQVYKLISESQPIVFLKATIIASRRAYLRESIVFLQTIISSLRACLREPIVFLQAAFIVRVSSGVRFRPAGVRPELHQPGAGQDRARQRRDRVRGAVGAKQVVLGASAVGGVARAHRRVVHAGPGLACTASGEPAALCGLKAWFESADRKRGLKAWIESVE